MFKRFVNGNIIIEHSNILISPFRVDGKTHLLSFFALFQIVSQGIGEKRILNCFIELLHHLARGDAI